MNTLFTNEKLGMPVEQLRLAEIRQEIEARRLAADVQGRRFGLGTLIQSLLTLVVSCKNRLYAKLPKQIAVTQITKI